MFSPTKVTQHQLQENFYAVLEPEINALVSFNNLIKEAHPHHKKRLTKYAKTYLLDVAELNMKSRCVFCWTGLIYITNILVFLFNIVNFLSYDYLISLTEPTYSGFSPLPDIHMLPRDDIIKGRRKYFPESDHVALTFMKDYIGERRLYYHNIVENRQTMRSGFIFFIVTCILDVIVCTI